MASTRTKVTGGKTAKPAAAQKNGKADEPSVAIVIDKIAAETILVPIIGTSPLIVHRFNEKAKRQMLDAMQGRKSPKQPKDPEAEYEAAFYRLEDGTPGMLAGAFKDATVGGARFYSQVKMTELKSFLRFLGPLGSDGRMMVAIDGEPKMREDVVRVNRGGSDMRYRPEFWPWRTTLTISYPTSMLTRSSVLSLVDAGGLGVGVGEWRAEKGGEFGAYRVDPDRDVEVIG